METLTIPFIRFYSLVENYLYLEGGRKLNTNRYTFRVFHVGNHSYLERGRKLRNLECWLWFVFSRNPPIPREGPET